MKHKQAFSLIELMVVISIIAVLAAMGVANFATAIKKSRDSVRKSELAELTQALMMFRADWGSYPYYDGMGKVKLTSAAILEYAEPASDPSVPAKKHGLVPEYIRSMPTDEARVSENEQYTYQCITPKEVIINGTPHKRCVDFSVCASLEVPQVSGANAQDDIGTSCASASNCKWFCMYSP